MYTSILEHARYARVMVMIMISVADALTGPNASLL